MYRRLRTTAVWLFALSLLASIATPSMAQAAAPHAIPAIAWSGQHNYAVSEGYHEFAVIARFRVPHKITNAYFVVHTSGGVYARQPWNRLGNVDTHLHALAFTLVVPASVKPGTYSAFIRLERWEGRHDFDALGSPFYFWVHVSESHHEAPAVSWMPHNYLGTIAVDRGQTVTELVTVTARTALTNVQIRRGLTDDAVEHGLTVSVVPTTPFSLLAGQSMPVVMTLSAGPAARVALYNADLHVVRVGDDRLVIIPAALHFKVAVRYAAPVAARIYWAAPIAPVLLQPGQTVTETESFTSSAALSGTVLARSISDEMAERGIAVTLTSTLPTTISAGQVVPVAFTVSAAPTAQPTAGIAVVFVKALDSSGLLARVPGNLAFQVKVALAPAPIVTWTSGSPVSFASITKSISTAVSVGENATFVASSPLVNAQYMPVLSAAAVHNGITITPVQPAAGTTLSSGTAAFTITVPSSAHVGLYSGVLYVTTMPAGASKPVAVHYGLHFYFIVNAPAA